jgi:hypothetical protein
MAQQQVARSRPRSKQQDADAGDGRDGQVADYEHELAGYLQERIKPGLNRGAIPLLARSIAKDIAHREPPPSLAEGADADADEEPRAGGGEEATDEMPQPGDTEAMEEAGAQAEEEDEDEDGESQSDFEADMHDLQAELGEDWIVRFSVQGDDAWLTAEKDDGSQRVEAPTAAVLTEAVELLNERGGRSA